MNPTVVTFSIMHSYIRHKHPQYVVMTSFMNDPLKSWFTTTKNLTCKDIKKGHKNFNSKKFISFFPLMTKSSNILLEPAFWHDFCFLITDTKSNGSIFLESGPVSCSFVFLLQQFLFISSSVFFGFAKKKKSWLRRRTTTTWCWTSSWARSSTANRSSPGRRGSSPCTRRLKLGWSEI